MECTQLYTFLRFSYIVYCSFLPIITVFNHFLINHTLARLNSLTIRFQEPLIQSSYHQLNEGILDPVTSFFKRNFCLQLISKSIQKHLRYTEYSIIIKKRLNQMCSLVLHLKITCVPHCTRARLVVSLSGGNNDAADVDSGREQRRHPWFLFREVNIGDTDQAE